METLLSSITPRKDCLEPFERKRKMFNVARAIITNPDEMKAMNIERLDLGRCAHVVGDFALIGGID